MTKSNQLSSINLRRQSLNLHKRVTMSQLETTPLSTGDEDYYFEPKKPLHIQQRMKSFSGKDAKLLEEGFSWRNFWKFTGPGWLMSIAYLDPGNLESDLQAAALCGNSLLFVLFWSHVLGLIFQNLSSQLGLVTSRHLASHIRAKYPPYLSTILWIMCELAIIGSDIQEIIGTSIALNILFSFPLWLGVIITGFDTMLFLTVQRWGMHRLESLFIGSIGVMASCFVIEMVWCKPEWMTVIEGLVKPEVPRFAWVQAMAMVGAIIMPHNLYLHSALSSQKEIDRQIHSKSQIQLANLYLFLESVLTLFISFLINLSIMVVFSSVFYYSNGSQPQYNVGLADAANALANTLGNNAKYLWAIGLLAAGQSSTMTGTLTGQYVMEGYWKLSLSPVKRVFFTRSLALIPSILVAILAEDYLDILGEYLNALQSIQLPFALLPLLALVSDKKIMGHFKIGGFQLKIYYFIVAILLSLNAFLIKNLCEGLISSVFTAIPFFIFIVSYITLILKVIRC